jgi:predicted aspartyl protease
MGKRAVLVDTGADRTVLSADLLEALGIPSVSTVERLGGVGGVAASVMVESQLRFAIEGVGKATFKGRFAAFTDAETVDMSVLGRDILNVFALIVDRQGNTISLLGQQHYYSINER